MLHLADLEARLILALDKDFWRLALRSKAPLNSSGVIMFRVHPATAPNFEPLVRLFTQLDQPWAGHVSIISRTGVEMLVAGRM